MSPQFLWACAVLYRVKDSVGAPGTHNTLLCSTKPFQGTLNVYTLTKLADSAVYGVPILKCNCTLWTQANSRVSNIVNILYLMMATADRQPKLREPSKSYIWWLYGPNKSDRYFQMLMITTESHNTLPCIRKNYQF